MDSFPPAPTVDVTDILDGMAEAFVLTDAAFRLLEVNAAAARMDSCPRKQMLGRTVWDVWPGLAGSALGDMYRRVMGSRVAAQMEYHYVATDVDAWLDVRAQPARGGGLAIFYRDVSKRRFISERLAIGEESLRLATEAAEVGVWDVDIVNDVLTWSVRTRAMFGISPGSPCSMADFYAGLHPDDREATSVAYLSALDPVVRATYDVEYRTIGKEDGVTRWVAAKGRGLFDAEGRCVRALGTAIDITARRAAQERLRASEAALIESEAKFRAIAGSIDQMIWSTRPDGYHDFYNQRWYDFTGIKAGSTDGGAWDGLFHPDDRARAWERWRESLATGALYEIEYRLRHWSGVWRWVLGRAVPQRDADGTIVRWFGTCTDIEDIVRARDVLARSRAELETLVAARTRERDRTWRNARDLLAVTDAQGVMLSVNPAWTTLLGYAESELIGRNYVEFVVPEDRARSGAALLQARDRPLDRFENHYRHKDGSVRTIDWLATPSEGTIFAYGRDVTAERAAAVELAATQAQLRQAQKMEAVGQLTGGVAHDFNNLLQIVIGNLELVAGALPQDNARLRKYADNAMRGANRAATLTQRLLAFSRRQPLAPRPVDANALVLGMSDLLARSLGETVTVATSLAENLWRIEADPHQLESALLNLAVNARDAMTGPSGQPGDGQPGDGQTGGGQTGHAGGRLTIRTANVTTDLSEPDAPAGDYVVITVIDTGTGMDPATVARACEPFFTTKEVGRGTGLGLAMVYGFVAQSGGHLRITSVPAPGPGQGTTVRVALPRVTHAATAAPPQPGPRTLGGKPSETVLVVEDDADVRAFSAEVLRSLGYTVLEAADGVQALLLLKSTLAADVALLFTDVVLPGGLSGADVARHARAKRPGLRVLFTSGYARQALDHGDHGGRLDPGVELLTKPFTADDLAARARAVLDA